MRDGKYLLGRLEHKLVRRVTFKEIKIEKKWERSERIATKDIEAKNGRFGHEISPVQLVNWL